MQARIDSIPLHLFSLKEYQLDVLREDVLLPEISGNKYRKLKYNLLRAQQQGHDQLITFGGAFSNHIAATAAAGAKHGFKTVGVIRGEELDGSVAQNSTLAYAANLGMKLHFVSREDYRQKEDPQFMKHLFASYGKGYVLPEGGTNALAIKGCAEMLSDQTDVYDIICVSVGTGGTLAGIVTAAAAHQMVEGFSALKGNFQKNSPELEPMLKEVKITDAYCFGGYAKIDSALVRFMNTFFSTTGILLDPVYTAKMMYGIFDQIKKQGWKKNSRILAIHTGGLQGISGMNRRLKHKNLPQINV